MAPCEGSDTTGEYLFLQLTDCNGTTFLKLPAATCIDYNWSHDLDSRLCRDGQDRRLPDVNVLQALTVASHIDHAKAKPWYLEGNPFALTPVTEMGLVRLLMNLGIPDCGYLAAEALATLNDLKASSSCHFWPDDLSF